MLLFCLYVILNVVKNLCIIDRFSQYDKLGVFNCLILKYGKGKIGFSV